MTATASWVSKRPDRYDGDACVRDIRIPIGGLVNYRRLGMTDDDILHAYPSLTRTDLEVAFAYAASHAEEIDLAIRENEEGEDGFVE